MISEQEVDDPEEFQTKLSQLSDQWQSVIRRASQRKEIIDRNIRWDRLDFIVFIL